MMKRILLPAALMALLAVPAITSAQNDALSAFEQLTGKQVQLEREEKTSEIYLDEVVSGVYLTPAADMEAAKQMAQALEGLCAVSNKDITVYSQAKGYEEARVRNLYYRSLANVLRAQIMVDPATQEQYRNIEVILTLFIDNDDDQVMATTRKAIRSSMDERSAREMAKNYNLPKEFIEFVIMNENWNDDDWNNDEEWTASVDSAYFDTEDADTPQALPTQNPAEDSTPDYATDDDTPEYDTPEYDSPDTPEYDTPEYDTPEYDTPEYNTPDTPEVSSPDTPETPDTPDTPDSDSDD